MQQSELEKAHETTKKLWQLRRNEEHADRFLFRKLKTTKKGIIVHAKAIQGELGWNALHPEEIMLVFYPQLRHAKEFARAVESVRRGGPADFFTGAVGSLKMTKAESGTLAHASFVQAHFKTDGEGVKNGLKRSLATEYGGWRRHLLREFFKQNGNVKTITISCREYGNVRKDVRDLAEKHGFNVEDNNTFLRLKRK